MFKKACPESFRRVRPARPQPFPAFVAHFGGVGLTRGAYSQYVSVNAEKSGKSVSPKVRQNGDHVCASRFGKARERCWRLFSTLPSRKNESLDIHNSLRSTG